MLRTGLHQLLLRNTNPEIPGWTLPRVVIFHPKMSDFEGAAKLPRRRLCHIKHPKCHSESHWFSIIFLQDLFALCLPKQKSPAEESGLPQRLSSILLGKIHGGFCSYICLF